MQLVLQATLGHRQHYPQLGLYLHIGLIVRTLNTFVMGVASERACFHTVGWRFIHNSEQCQLRGLGLFPALHTKYDQSEQP